MKSIRKYNVGKSDYCKHKIQPWDIWLEYGLNPWDADIVKRVLRNKDGEDRATEYKKIIHVCQERLRQLGKLDDTRQETQANIGNTDIAKIKDGVYYIYADGSIENAENNPQRQVSYIGLVQGSKSIAIALHDASPKEGCPLTEKNSEDEKSPFYLDTCAIANADWEGAKNTEHLRKTARLHKGIQLSSMEYIPAMGELRFIYDSLYDVNRAIRIAGGDPIMEDWYWSSTEFSSTTAWFLRLYNGYMYHYHPKASYRLRVRAVSAFIS